MQKEINGSGNQSSAEKKEAEGEKARNVRFSQKFSDAMARKV